VFPVIGFRIITELTSSNEDLPRQGEDLFTTLQESARMGCIASVIMRLPVAYLQEDTRMQAVSN
jgi:hypothetical protein